MLVTFEASHLDMSRLKFDVPNILFMEITSSVTTMEEMFGGSE